uniref:orotidine-5'-phosphate decarboxylase n=2 Tax=Lygus hesperus TaxID=30085 RepID=A0A0A9YNM7_LYGHE
MVDREQGGIRNLTDNGITMHSILTLSKALSILLENGKLDQKKVDEVKAYIEANQIFPNGDLIPKNRLKMKFNERVDHAQNPLARLILDLMEQKKSNLCVALDVPTWEEAVRILHEVGDYVVVVKTHFDTFPDWSPARGEQLNELAKKYRFIIVEDRKFGDIGNVIKSQVRAVFGWAQGVTMHTICGEGSLDGVRMAIKEMNDPPFERGVFLVSELSCAENLISTQYTKKTTELAVQFSQVVTGLVAQSPLLIKEPGFVQLTPGVSSKPGGDNLGQTYVTPSDAVLLKGGDLIVVGRAITQSSDPKDAARKMRNELWNAYVERVSDGLTTTVERHLDQV